MIDAIAVDMDGTFLNEHGTYDHEWFQALLPQLEAAGIQFVVASGNPHYQLRQQFAEVADRIMMVAENGGEIVVHGQLVESVAMQPDSVAAIAKLRREVDARFWLISTAEQAYLMDDVSDEVWQVLTKHYLNLKRLDDWTQITAPIVKMQLDVMPNQVTAVQQLIQARVPEITGVSSGYGNLDLIATGCDKATGLQRLADEMGWQPSQVMAFGDGQNDVTMLKWAGYSYAMANGMNVAKQVAKFSAPANTEQGVRQVIEQYLKQNAPK